MKAGTAHKMVLNMISTGAMTRLGYVYGNLMVNVWTKNEKLVERAEKTKGRRRVFLPVGFVRQHWKTCSPATLSAIGRFFQVLVHVD